jgi:transglutaminase-like putative cysteine protease
VVGDAPDRAEAAKRIYDFVYEGVQKSPTIGIPNGLQVLRTMRGDCNEHTALYVTLARAAGIPSRIAAGVVYNSTLGQGFYYHAWPEVRLGVDEAWVSIDPTLGQFPARATHLKLVTGDLDRQIEIIGTIGRLALEVVPTPAPAAGAVGYDGAP